MFCWGMEVFFELEGIGWNIFYCDVVNNGIFRVFLKVLMSVVLFCISVWERVVWRVVLVRLVVFEFGFVDKFWSSFKILSLEFLVFEVWFWYCVRFDFFRIFEGILLFVVNVLLIVWFV